MNEITNTYDPARLESIRRVLENEQRRGSPRYYEIGVDGVKVVERTNNPEEFSKYEEFLYADTQKVTVNLYTSSQTSPHVVSKHHFTFQDEQKTKEESLRGFGLGEIEARINEKVSLERERWDCEQVKKKLSETEFKLQEAEEWNEQLQGIIDETKKKLEEAKGISEITGILKDLALPHLLGKKAEEKQSLSGSEKPQEEASFKMKTEENSQLSEDDKFFLDFGNKMKSSFNKEEFDMVFDIIGEFLKDKTNIKPVTELLTINQTKK